MNSFFNFKKLFDNDKVCFDKVCFEKISSQSHYVAKTRDKKSTTIVKVLSPENTSYLSSNRNPYQVTMGLRYNENIKYFKINEDIKSILIKAATLSFENNIFIDNLIKMNVLERDVSKDQSFIKDYRYIKINFNRKFEGLESIRIIIHNFKNYIEKNENLVTIIKYDFNENLLYINEEILDKKEVNSVIENLKVKMKKDANDFIDYHANRIKEFINGY